MSLRLIPVAIVLALGLVGCEGESTVASTDDPGEDQALALSVMGARGDTLTAAVENEIVDTGPPPDLIAIQPQARPSAPSPSMPPAVVRTVVPSEPAPQKQSTPQPVPRIALEPPPVRVADAQPAEKPRERERDEESVPVRRGTISPGATLSLVTTRQVCNEDATVGNTIRAVVTNPIRGSNGTAIPEGAQAVAEITSIDKWGAGIGLRVKSIRVDGRNYPVTSRVSYVLPEGNEEGACIRQRTRLEVETKEPISVALR